MRGRQELRQRLDAECDRADAAEAAHAEHARTTERQLAQALEEAAQYSSALGAAQQHQVSRTNVAGR